MELDADTPLDAWQAIVALGGVVVVRDPNVLYPFKPAAFVPASQVLRVEEVIEDEGP